jgi:hypothetical protein
MNSQVISDLLEARPFRSFTLLVDAESGFVVDDPNLAKLHGNGDTLLLKTGPGVWSAGAIRYVDLKLIVSVLVGG